MSRIDRGQAIRAMGFVSLIALAVITAIVSYQHGLDVVRSAGTRGRVAYLLPLVPDLTVASSSLAILDAVHRNERRSAFAVSGLVFGVITTLTMNVAAGLRFGVAGAMVAALAPVALVLSYETLMSMVRAHGRTLVELVQEDETGCSHRLNESPEDNAVMIYEHIRDCLGKEPSQRQLSTMFGLSRPRFKDLVGDLGDAA